MGGEGSMMGMIISLKNNRALLRNRRKYFNKDKMNGVAVSYHKAIRIKKFTPAQLESFRRRLAKDRKNDTLRIIFALITAIGLALALVIWILQIAGD
jgi:hypothetical protein